MSFRVRKQWPIFWRTPHDRLQILPVNLPKTYAFGG